ncbi:MAG: response regulator transcription factor [bacterium]|nr:response regulator transcription factor [bacterium]
MYKVLLIDDDKDLCRLIKNNLEREGYTVSVQHSGDTGITEAMTNEYEIVILDVMLPVKNGFEVLTEIRRYSNIPILMLTAKDSEGDKVSGLRMGADDYITKPFSSSELSARIESLLRRYFVLGNHSMSNQNRVLKIGGLSVDIEKHEVEKNGVLIDLTAKEFDLLVFFATNQGRVFTKRQIYHNVWKDEYAFDDNNITVHIRRLRKKIEDNPDVPVYILTVWGVGYKLNGELR